MKSPVVELVAGQCLRPYCHLLHRSNTIAARAIPYINIIITGIVIRACIFPDKYIAAPRLYSPFRHPVLQKHYLFHLCFLLPEAWAHKQIICTRSIRFACLVPNECIVRSGCLTGAGILSKKNIIRAWCYFTGQDIICFKNQWLVISLFQ